MKLSRTLRWAWFLALPLYACNNGSSGGGGAPPGPANVILETAANNDNPAGAQQIGGIAPGDALRIEGNVSAFGGDQFDTYAVNATAAARLDLALNPGNAASDVDLWVAAPDGTVRELFGATTSGTENAQVDLAAGESVLLIVLAYDDGPYTLDLTARTP